MKTSTTKTESLEEIKLRSVGITKKEIAIRLDQSNTLFNYSCESGLTSYSNYTRDELLQHCIQFDVNPVSPYHYLRAGETIPLPMVQQQVQQITISFISKRLNEYVNGFLSSVKEIGKSGRQEILAYLDQYDFINELEAE